MSLKPAIEHSRSTQILKDTELKNGEVGVYSLSLRPDLPVVGFAPYPEGEIKAFRVIANGAEQFMFTNHMDDYARSSLIDLNDAVNPKLVGRDFPHAHTQAISEDKFRTEQEIKIAAIAKQEADVRIRLQLLNLLTSHLNLPKVETYEHRSIMSGLSETLKRIEAAQGKLDLSSMPQNREYGQIPVGERSLSTYRFDKPLTHPDISRNLAHLEYVAKFKHDISAVFSDESVDIKILGPKGNVLSQATLPIFVTDNIEGTAVEDDEEFEYDSPCEFISVVADSEYEIRPSFVERGRPVTLESSRFAPIYNSLYRANIVPADAVSYVPGMAISKTDPHVNVKFERGMRGILSHTGIAEKIGALLTPKPSQDKEVAIGLTA